MKSTNSEKRPFSMADFEKGLMLAGFVAPSTVSELNELRALEKHDKELAGKKKKTYFKRVVLAAEIANELYAEPTFGRIKFQKLVYLCEHAAKMDLHERYLKQSAGPFDNKFMHSIEKEFQKNNWFGVEKVTNGNITRSVYKPLEKIEKYKEYYSTSFEKEAHSIKYVIDLFRKQKSDFTEIAATLIACHKNLNTKKGDYSIEELIEEFYNWSERKSQFSESQVRLVWQWVIDKRLI